MFEQMTKQCCGADGKPDFEKMKHFMQQHDHTSQIDAIGWGLFFIWVGIAWYAGLGLGAGLLGVAVITLGMQAVHKLLHFKGGGFWILVGVLVALGGVWELMAIERPLVPVLLIVVGILIIGSGALKKFS